MFSVHYTVKAKYPHIVGPFELHRYQKPRNDTFLRYLSHLRMACGRMPDLQKEPVPVLAAVRGLVVVRPPISALPRFAPARGRGVPRILPLQPRRRPEFEIPDRIPALRVPILPIMPIIPDLLPPRRGVPGVPDMPPIA